MTKYLFIAATALALVVGCKGGGAANNLVDADANDADITVNDGIAGVDELGDIKDDNDVVDAAQADDSMNDGYAEKDEIDNDDAITESDEIDVDQVGPDASDNYYPDDDCPGEPAQSDCLLRDECGGDPFGLARCEGEVMHYCDEPVQPCVDGTYDFWQDCTETGGRCFNNQELGCGAACLPLADFVPTTSFEGEWREVGNIECYTGQTVAAIPQAIASLSFPAPNEFNIRWQGDDQIYTGVYENSEVQTYQTYLTTRWSFNAPYPVTSFCDYLFSSDGQTMTMTFANNDSFQDCLFYNGIWYIEDVSYCGHIFERIPEEQPDDDTLLTDTN